MRGWAGRPILRLEDPALVRGQGHFTADLPARFRVRFVRSAVAAGRIVRITSPDGATVFTIADLAGVKPIRPMLHKFGYIPIEQPVLADGIVRYVGDPVGVVVAVSVTRPLTASNAACAARGSSGEAFCRLERTEQATTRCVREIARRWPAVSIAASTMTLPGTSARTSGAPGVTASRAFVTGEAAMISTST